MSKPRIMIVEDEVIIAIQLEDRLKARGYDVVGFAKTGEEAVKMAGSLKPDLILMDIVMPGKLDGIDTATRIKKEQNIPVVFLTAFADDTLIKRAKEAEPYGYIIKPYREKEIIAVIELALNKRDLERKLAKEELKKYGDRLEKLVERRTARLIKTNERLEREIKERKRAGETLKKSEEKWRSLVKNAPNIIINMDHEGTIQFINRTLPGFSVEETIGTKIYDYIDRKYHNLVRETVEKVFLSGEPGSYEIKGAGPQGRDAWYSTQIGPIRHNGRIVAATLITTDITSYKVIQNALNKSEKKYRELYDEAPVGYHEINRHGRITKVNKTEAVLLGYSPEEMVGKFVWEFMPENQQELSKKSIRKKIRQKITEEGFERKYLCRDGKQIDAYIGDRLKLDKNGKTVGIRSTLQNITGRKRAEEALKESEERYRELVENINDLVYAVDTDGVIIYISPVAESILGYTPAEIIGRHFTDFIYDEDVPLLTEKFIERLTGKIQATEYRISRKSGEIRWIRTSSKPIFKGDKIVGLLGVLSDVNERKQAEETLRESEDLLRRVIETAPPCIFVKDRDGKYLLADKQTADLHGVTSEAMVGKTDLDFLHMAITTSKEVEVFLADDREVIDSKQKKLIPAESFTLSDGTVRWFETVKVPLSLRGNPDCVLGVGIDITERKRAEEALLDSENKYRELAESISDVFFAIDKDLRYTYWNKASEKLTGISAEEALGKSLYDIFPDTRGSKTEKFYLDTIKKQKFQSIENIYRIVDKVYVFELNAYPSRDGLSVFVKDITMRKQAEEALRESEERFRQLAEASFEGITIHDQGILLRANDQFFKMFGYKPDELLGKQTINKLIAPESRELMWNRIRKGSADLYETIGVRKDGTEFPLELHPRQIEYKGRNVRVVAIRDITERKRAEEEIRRLSQFQESIIDNANVWFDVLDEKGNIVIWNKAAEEISGYPKDEVLGHAKIWEWLYPKKEYRKKIFEKALEIIHEHTVVENFETRIRSKNGEYKIISWHSRNLVDNAGKPIGSIALGRNVSKLKQAEEKLRKSREELSELAAYLQNIREEERKIISREIHDELGQVLTAMKIDLSLLRDNIPIGQTELVSKTETISRLLDTTISTVKRISSDLRPGLLDDLGLVPAIEWQVAEFVKRTGIEFKLFLPEKELAINQDLSTALFRILQEALTNITRHARATKVVISLKEKNGAVQLIVNDNGIGIGEKEALASSSLGLIGMRERVRSFDGEFDIKSEMSQGTTLEITIPLKR